MIKYLKIVVIIFLFVSNSQTCVDYVYSIHPLVASIGDAFTKMEANMRIQYNTIHLERAKILNSQYEAIEDVRKNLPRDLCKYSGTEESISFQQMGQEMINNVKKNLVYSTKAEFDEMRLDHSNYMFAHIQAMSDFVDEFFDPAKTYFADGKACVLGLEKNLKSYLETGAVRIIQCMKNATVTNPLMPPKFKNYIDFMTNTYTKQGTDMRRPFIFPVIIGYYSTKKQNETAAEALLKVMKGQLQSTLDVAKSMAQAGLDMIDAINSYSDAVKKCNKFVNVTYIAPKKEELLGNVRYCGGV